MFNVLGVGAFAGLATANKFVQLDWWPLTRDCCLYTFSILVLISFTWDGQISLRESAVMVSLVSVYILVLVFNQRIMHCIKWFVEINLNWCHLYNYGNYCCPMNVSVMSELLSNLIANFCANNRLPNIVYRNRFNQCYENAIK